MHTDVEPVIVARENSRAKIQRDAELPAAHRHGRIGDGKRVRIAIGHRVIDSETKIVGAIRGRTGVIQAALIIERGSLRGNFQRGDDDEQQNKLNNSDWTIHGSIVASD